MGGVFQGHIETGCNGNSYESTRMTTPIPHKLRVLGIVDRQLELAISYNHIGSYSNFHQTVFT